MNRTTLALLLVCGLIFTRPAWTRADGPSTQEIDDLDRLLRPNRSRAATEHERSHDTVKAAFRQVVSRPNIATVRVFSDGRHVALGTVVDSDGLILSKASELTGKLECQLHDGRRLKGELVGSDRRNDLGLVRVDAKGLTAIEWMSVAPSRGAWVATPGLAANPVAIGVVSAEARRIESPPAILGIQISDVGRDGPRVERVVERGGADRAGLRAFDIVTHIDEKRTPTKDVLIDLIRKYQPGDRVTVTLVRGEETLNVSATLSKKNDLPHEDRMDFQDSLGGPLSERRAGFPAAIQHDSVLRPQDCGGPLVDLDGRAIGINIARAGRVSSLAVPAAAIQSLLPELKSAERERELTRRYDRLKQSIAGYSRTLESLRDQIRKTDEAAVLAKQDATADETARQTLEKAQKDRAAAIAKAQQVRAALKEADAELKQLESEKLALGSKR